jgi:hypothetical protein
LNWSSALPIDLSYVPRGEQLNRTFRLPPAGLSHITCDRPRFIVTNLLGECIGDGVLIDIADDEEGLYRELSRPT